jgi:tetratricopeptide (TPR) repeat protein
MKEEKTAKNKAQAKSDKTADASRAQLLQSYASAMKLFQEGKVEKARSAFEAILQGDAGELAERVRVHLSACVRQINLKNMSFNGPEERYDYAMSLVNLGQYEDAREHLQAVLQEAPAADYAYYGLAVLEGMTGHADECLEALGEAIRLRPHNRVQARNDQDFQEMMDDPRFTELLYPESA